MISETLVEQEFISNNETAIELRNVYAGYKNHTILKDITMTMPKGACWAIIGPSGAGKTTLFKLITGLISPKQGEVAILEEELSHNTKKQRKRMKGRIGYIPQNLGLVSNLDVKQNILLGALGRTSTFASLLGLMSPIEYERAKDIMARLNISKLANKDVRSLSGGEKRRVAIARALLHQPEMLVADELLSELDIGTSHQVMKEIKALQESQGTSVILIEHNIDAAIEYADTIVVVSDGEILSIIESHETDKLDNIKDLMVKAE